MPPDLAVRIRKEPGVPSTRDAEPAPTRCTVGIELAGVAESHHREPEALEPWAGGEAGRERDTAPREDSASCERVLEALPPQGADSERTHGHNTAPQNVLTGDKHVLDAALPQATPTSASCRQGSLADRGHYTAL